MSNYCFDKTVYSNWYRATMTDANIRMMNALTDVPVIDIYSNNKLIISGLRYSEVSQYIPVSAGQYNIKVYPAGSKINPISDTNINIPLDTITNIAVIGTSHNASIYPVPEPLKANSTGSACIRVVALSSNAPVVDLTKTDGTTIFANIMYKDYTLYVCLPPAGYTFQVREAGTNKIILTIAYPDFKADNFYSIYLLGLYDGYPPFEAVIIPEPR